MLSHIVRKRCKCSADSLTADLTFYNIIRQMKIFLYYEENRRVLDIHLKMFGSNVSHYLGELCIYPFGECFLLHCVVLICAGKEQRRRIDCQEHEQVDQK